MIKIGINLSLIFLLYVNGFTQSEEVTTKFYKKLVPCSKEVSENKAKYKVLTWGNKEGWTIKETYLNESNRLIKRMSTDINGDYVGLCSHLDDNDELIEAYYWNDLKETEYLSYFGSEDKVDFTPARYEGESEYLPFGSTFQLRYPREARNAGIQGKMEVLLKISSNGKAERVSVFKGLIPILDAEAYRIFENMKDWKPAVKDGVAVDSYMIVPISFYLE